MRLMNAGAMGARLMCVLTAVAVSAVLTIVSPAVAQLSTEDVVALRQRGEREGWTFTVAENEVTRRGERTMTGLIEPPDWRKTGRFDPCEPRRDLPAAFDWRDYDGCTPIRNQGSCGSCWAFSAIGPMECGIRIEDGVSVDLSEQWLVSCTEAGTCDGGWPGEALEYLRCDGDADPCGDRGAVYESDFPYEAADVYCGCPYDHPYCIQSWAYVGSSGGIPSPEQIKQAIYDHGPVSVCLTTEGAFGSYDSGVYNDCQDGEINHAVVLVGWDDNQGSEGVWILRNSWGTGWGEGGYMRIEYGCNRIGYAAAYVDYLPTTGLWTTPGDYFTATGLAGGPFTPDSVVYTIENRGDEGFNYEITTSKPWVSISSETGYLGAGVSKDVTLSINSAAESLGGGYYYAVVEFKNTTDHVGDSLRLVNLEIGELAPVFVFDMSTDPGWAAEGQWSYGSPTGGGGEYGGPDPTNGYTGGKVYGYNLNGDYPNDLPEKNLTSQSLDFRGLRNTHLKFRRWLGVEQPEYDHARVSVSTNGADFETVWSNADEVADSSWVFMDIDISDIVDDKATVFLRWTMGQTDGGWRYCGWNIDDVEIWAIAPPECVQDITGDGTVDVLDLLAILGAWGQSGGAEDITDDGTVDVLDLLEVLGAWGPC